MSYADFESILVPETNEKQNPDVSYTKIFVFIQINIKIMLGVILIIN